MYSWNRASLTLTLPLWVAPQEQLLYLSPSHTLQWLQNICFHSYPDRYPKGPILISHYATSLFYRLWWYPLLSQSIPTPLRNTTYPQMIGTKSPQSTNILYPRETRKTRPKAKTKDLARISELGIKSAVQRVILKKDGKSIQQIHFFFLFAQNTWLHWGEILAGQSLFFIPSPLCCLHYGQRASLCQSQIPCLLLLLQWDCLLQLFVPLVPNVITVMVLTLLLSKTAQTERKRQPFSTYMQNLTSLMLMLAVA